MKGHNIHFFFFKALPEDAPVLVVAPHATFVDTFAILIAGATPVAKAEFKSFFMLGKLARFVQVRKMQGKQPNMDSAFKLCYRRHFISGLL